MDIATAPRKRIKLIPPGKQNPNKDQPQSLERKQKQRKINQIRNKAKKTIKPII